MCAGEPDMMQASLQMSCMVETKQKMHSSTNFNNIYLQRFEVLLYMKVLSVYLSKGEKMFPLYIHCAIFSHFWQTSETHMYA